VIDDRPVSLAAVEEIIRAREFSFTSDDEFRRALLDVRALPTKPPREMPAPEWTGPDRWQHWAAEFAHHPDDHAGPAPAGFVQIGPWESVTFVSTSPSEPPIRDWRRPLRRVQG
jgi:hypothetical protein